MKTDHPLLRLALLRLAPQRLALLRVAFAVATLLAMAGSAAAHNHHIADTGCHFTLLVGVFCARQNDTPENRTRPGSGQLSARRVENTAARLVSEGYV